MARDFAALATSACCARKRRIEKKLPVQIDCIRFFFFSNQRSPSDRSLSILRWFPPRLVFVARKVFVAYFSLSSGSNHLHPIGLSRSWWVDWRDSSTPVVSSGGIYILALLCFCLFEKSSCAVFFLKKAQLCPHYSYETFVCTLRYCF